MTTLTSLSEIPVPHCFLPIVPLELLFEVSTPKRLNGISLEVFTELWSDMKCPNITQHGHCGGKLIKKTLTETLLVEHCKNCCC